MASTSRSLFLLSLLVSSFCMTATASRSLEQETNKLSLGGVDTLLDKILHGNHGLIHLVLRLDLSEVLHPVEILLENTVGGVVKLDVVEGLVTELKEPIVVKVTAAGTVNIVVKVLGKKVSVPLKLSELDPLEIVGDVVHVVLKLVEKVVEGEEVVQILNSVGDLLESITGGL